MGKDRNQLVYIIDDDESILRALWRLVRSAGFEVKTYTSGRSFLSSDFQEGEACLVVDVKMPNMSGLQLHEELLGMNINIPIIFITAHDTEEIRRKAKAAGAAGYFRKPIDGQALIDSIRWALSVRK